MALDHLIEGLIDSSQECLEAYRALDRSKRNYARVRQKLVDCIKSDFEKYLSARSEIPREEYYIGLANKRPPGRRKVVTGRTLRVDENGEVVSEYDPGITIPLFKKNLFVQITIGKPDPREYDAHDGIFGGNLPPADVSKKFADFIVAHKPLPVRVCRWKQVYDNPQFYNN